VASLVAADHITGMPWEYLLAWTAAPVAGGLVAGAVTVSEHIERIAGPALAALAASAAIVGLGAVGARVPLQASTSTDVAVATDALLARYHPGRPVGLIAYGLPPFDVAEGVADQLVRRGIGYGVPERSRFQFPYSVSEAPAEWDAFTVPGAPIPAGYHTVATTPGVAVSVGTRPPPGW
jgi:hypothetical protein